MKKLWILLLLAGCVGPAEYRHDKDVLTHNLITIAGKIDKLDAKIEANKPAQCPITYEIEASTIPWTMPQGTSVRMSFIGGLTGEGGTR